VTTALSNWDIVSDAELARAAAMGDRHAFAEIYDRYADRLHDFCVGMVRDRDAAADCVQDVFCSAATQLTKLRDPDRLRPWLYAIARNEALRCIRDRRREQVSDELPEAASHEAGPDTLAARTELADLIAQAAGGLSDRDRTVLELAYQHGMDGPELADALEVSPSNANRMVSRLRDTIETSLGALLVARRARHTADGCAELGAILAGWDGRFSVLMRKRIARHIESCPICEEERRRLISPAALLGVPVFIPAPAALRDQTLGQIKLTSADSDLYTSSDGYSLGSADATRPLSTVSTSDADDWDNQDHPDDAQPRRARALIPWIALFAAAFLFAIGLTITLLFHSNTAVSPTELSGKAPAPKPSAPPTAGMILNSQSPPPAAPPANTPAPAMTVPPGDASAPMQAPAATIPPAIPTAQPPAALPPVVAPPPVFVPPPVLLPPPVLVPPPAAPAPAKAPSNVPAPPATPAPHVSTHAPAPAVPSRAPR
jgi:RNA polymerase sigma factor (sigma-70 family)